MAEAPGYAGALALICDRHQPVLFLTITITITITITTTINITITIVLERFSFQLNFLLSGQLEWIFLSDSPRSTNLLVFTILCGFQRGNGLSFIFTQTVSGVWKSEWQLNRGQNVTVGL